MASRIENAHERWRSMQADRDAGMKVFEIAEKYGVSVALVRQKTRRNAPKKYASAYNTKKWSTIEAQLNELVKINRRVRRRNAIYRKPRDISAYGHTFRHWPEEEAVNRKWPKEK